MPNSRGPSFESLAHERRGGLISEVWLFLRQNKKWWLLPVLVVLSLLAGLLILTTTAAGPFIYTLF